MKSLKRVFAPPVLEDGSKTQQAYMLHIILWTLIIAPIPYVFYTLVWNVEGSGRALAQAAYVEAASILILVVLRGGHVGAASIMQVGFLWLFFTASAWTGNGVQGESYLVGYTLVITMAGILLGGAGALAVTTLSLGAGGYMVYLSQGVAGGGQAVTPLTTWAISFILFTVIAILQYLASRRLRTALARATLSEEKYRLISRVTSDYLFSTRLDVEGNMRLDWVAGAFESMTGYTFEEYLVNGGWRAHLHPDDVEIDNQALTKLKANQQAIHELRTYKKSGEIQWVRVYAHPIWDQQFSRLTAIVGAVQDINRQKQVEDREAERRRLLEKIVLLGQQMTEVKDLRTTLERIWHGVHDYIGFDRLAIFLYDQETNTVNGTLGTDNDGRMVEEWDYQRTLDHKKPTSFMRALEQPNGLFYTGNFAEEFDIPEGHEMHFVKDFAAVAAWAGDKPVAIITVDNNPSGRPFTQVQLESLRLFAGYAGLAIENSHLNAALKVELDQRQNFITELENKNAELERFTYTVSHDLKSPLVTITGFLGFLEKDALSGDWNRAKGSIDRISAAAKKMQTLLNDLLELSRIGRIINPPQDVRFYEIVHEAIDHVRGRLDEVNAIVEIQRDLPAVHGDRVRLVEVVQNLVENAVKYAQPDGGLRIEIGTDGEKNRFHTFYVRDNGIGIESQYHERIFGLFNKLDNQSEGSGIGLSLVKRIIEVHNGRIWVESEKGNGATFYFTLPAPPAKE